MVSWFLDNGADPNRACPLGTSPLSTAVARAPLSIVEMLLQKFPDTTNFQRQLLHFAARRTDDESGEVLRLVLDRCQPDVNAWMFEDCPLAYECYKVTGLGTALREVARTGRLDLAGLLIAHGADVSIRDSCGRTAYELAQLAGHECILDLLKQL